MRGIPILSCRTSAAGNRFLFLSFSTRIDLTPFHALCPWDTGIGSQAALELGMEAGEACYRSPLIRRLSLACVLQGLHTTTKRRFIVLGHRYYLLLFLLTILAASEPGQRSGIEGFVTSDIGAAIPSATIGVDSVTRGFHRETVTDTSGYYLVGELNPGAYSVWAEVDGLGCIVYPHVEVLPGQLLRKDFYFARANRYPRNCEPLQRKSK